MKYRLLSSAASLVNWNLRTFTCSKTLSCNQSFAIHRACVLHHEKATNFRTKSTSTGSKLYSTGLEKNKDEETHHEPENHKVYIEPSDNEIYHEIEQELASKHSIPILSQSTDANDGFNEGADVPAYTHRIRILPYEYESIETYAIGIQPVESEHARDRNSRKKKKAKIPQMQPVFIDFCPPLQSNLGKRFGGQKQGGELLLKAVSPAKYGNNADEVEGGAIVYDLTAGFGQDSMILAGGKTSQVHLVERDPIVALLLKDAYRRLELISNMDEADDRAYNLVKKLHIHQSDAKRFCQTRLVELEIEDQAGKSTAPDVCYLDPMFPPRTKSAAVKKNMQILHGLLHTNEKQTDEERRWLEERDLLLEALALAKSRVVVKRPIKAPPLGTSIEMGKDIRLPSFDLRGSINRFDVYIL